MSSICFKSSYSLALDSKLAIYGHIAARNSTGILMTEASLPPPQQTYCLVSTLSLDKESLSVCDYMTITALLHSQSGFVVEQVNLSRSSIQFPKHFEVLSYQHQL